MRERELLNQINELIEDQHGIANQIEVCESEIEHYSTELSIAKRSRDDLYQQYKDITNELEELEWKKIQKEERLKKKRVKRLQTWGILINE